MNTKIQHIHQACRLLREQHSGILSTHSVSCDGFPFGSVTPYLLTAQGDMVIYASDIAQHSRNMQRNNKVSLCIADTQQDDSQASGRVTVLAEAIVDGVDENTQQQYMTLFPQAKAYAQTHDFRFYLLKTHRVRYIGGFGKIFWFEQADWSEQMYPVENVQPSIDHMHQDHQDALQAIVDNHTHTSGIDSPLPNKESDIVTMLSCTQHGFHYQLTGAEPSAAAIQFVPFLQPISDDYGLRQAMVELTEQARRELKPQSVA